MTNKNTLIVLDNTTTLEDLKSSIQNPNTTYTLYIQTKNTKQQDVEQVESMRTQLDIPEKNHTTINISSIVQKTWRIIKHYSPNEAVPNKNTPDRKKELQRISQLNQSRLDQLEKAITNMVISDQSTKLNAIVKFIDS